MVESIGANPLIVTATSETAPPDTAGSTESAPPIVPATHCESSMGNPTNVPSFPFPDESEATSPEVSSNAHCNTKPSAA